MTTSTHPAWPRIVHPATVIGITAYVPAFEAVGVHTARTQSTDGRHEERWRDEGQRA